MEPGNSNTEGKRKTVRVGGVSRVIGVDKNIQFSKLIINSLLIFSTLVYNTVKIKLIVRETNAFCNN